MVAKSTNTFNNLPAGTPWVYTRKEVGTGNRVPDGTETALVSPFSPVKEQTSSSGFTIAQVDNKYVVEWQDGTNGDNVSYDVAEEGHWITRTDTNVQFLAWYESKASGNLYSKTAGNIIVHRTQIEVVDTQLTSATYTTGQSPTGNETTMGIVQYATTAQARAATATNRAMSPARVKDWWDNLASVALSKIPNLPAGRISSGVFDRARIPTATMTAKGSVELATSAEGTTGTATDVVPTVAVTKGMIDTHAPIPARAVKSLTNVSFSRSQSEWYMDPDEQITTLSITPKSSTSKVLITWMGGSHYGNRSNSTFFYIRKGTTNLARWKCERFGSDFGGGQGFPVYLMAVDSPATTSEVTYNFFVLLGDWAQNVTSSTTTPMIFVAEEIP